MLGRPGGDRLSRVLRHSTMGAGVFNGRVRDGIGFFRTPLRPPGRRSTRCVRQAEREHFRFERKPFRPERKPFALTDGRCGVGWSSSCVRGVDPDTDHESDQACRAISTGQLNASPRLHSRPIDVVVFHGPQGRPRFEVGFPLRCLQRLSRPYIAMLHCRWRDNSSTRGTFIPVLSY